MPGASLAEIYFIGAMFILIIVISGVATYFFFRTYKKEKADRQKRIEKQKSKTEN
jgi:cbb3-type cytochrome oxidase subunit 3